MEKTQMKMMMNQKTNWASKVFSEEKNEFNIEAAPSYIKYIDILEKKSIFVNVLK